MPFYSTFFERRSLLTCHLLADGNGDNVLCKEDMLDRCGERTHWQRSSH
jgi:hypothetical protein